MSSVTKLVRRVLAAALVMGLGVVSGELLSPQPLQATSCSFSRCFVNADLDDPDSCGATIEAEHCDDSSLSCSTVACDGGGDDPVAPPPE